MPGPPKQRRASRRLWYQFEMEAVVTAERRDNWRVRTVKHWKCCSCTPCALWIEPRSTQAMRLGKIAYYADFVLAPLLIAFLMWSAPVAATAAAVVPWLGWVAAGFVVWTLIEYVVHRFIYHHVPYFRDIHDAHHAEPEGLIGAPPVVGLALILLVFYVPVSGVGHGAACAFSIGGLIGYLGYMVLHHAAHHWDVKPGTWMFLARRHHALHHHAREDGNFGIVTSLWDHFFGTAITRRKSPKQRVLQ